MRKSMILLMTVALIISFCMCVFGEGNVSSEGTKFIEKNELIYSKGSFGEMYIDICNGILNIYFNERLSNIEKAVAINKLGTKYNYSLNGESIVMALVEYCEIHIDNTDNKILKVKDTVRNQVRNQILDEITKNIAPFQDLDDYDLDKAEDIKSEAKTFKNLDEVLGYYNINKVFINYEIKSCSDLYLVYDVLDESLIKYKEKEKLYDSVLELIKRSRENKNDIRNIAKSYIEEKGIKELADLNKLNRLLIAQSKSETFEEKDIADTYIYIEKNIDNLYLVKNSKEASEEMYTEFTDRRMDITKKTIEKLLRKRDVYYNFELEDMVAKVNTYDNLGYRTMEEAIQKEAIEKMKFYISEEEIEKLVTVIAGEFSRLDNIEIPEELNKRRDDNNIQGNFYDIVYQLRIDDLESMINPDRISDRYLNYEYHGFESSLQSLESLVKEIVLESNFDETIISVLIKSDYNIEKFQENIKEEIHDKDYLSYVDNNKLTEILGDNSIEKESRVVGLFMDGIIEYGRDDLQYFVEYMDENKDRTICDSVNYNINYYLKRKNMGSLINEIDDPAMFYREIKREFNDRSQIEDKIYREYFFELPVEASTHKINIVSQELTEILNTDYSLELVDDKSFIRVIGYTNLEYDMKVETSDIVEAFVNPEKYGTKDTMEALSKVAVEGKLMKMASDLYDVISSDSSEKQIAMKIMLNRYNLDGLIEYKDIEKIMNKTNSDIDKLSVELLKVLKLKY